MGISRMMPINEPDGEETKMMRRAIPNDVKITIILLFLGSAAVGLGIPVLAAPVILLLPGYSLTTALFPGKGDLDEIDRLLLIFGMNISLVPSMALAVNAFGFNLFGPVAPLFTSLSSATVFFTLVSVVRRNRISQPAWDIMIPDLKIRWILPVILFLVAILAISGLQDDGPTEFYLLDKNGPIQDSYYHFTSTPGPYITSEALIVVSNHEEEGRFTVEVKAEGEILEEHQFTLKRGEDWTHRFGYDLSNQNGSEDKVIDLVLYRDEEPIRRLHILIRK